MDPDPGNFFKIYLIFLTIFLLIFILKPFRNEENFITFLFLKVQVWVLGVNKFFFCSIWLTFFADPDPDPVSQNLADPTDPYPDPKHWFLIN